MNKGFAIFYLTLGIITLAVQGYANIYATLATIGGFCCLITGIIRLGLPDVDKE